jgi:tRNA threonylcarbamoyladenosine biosynthesis protein TsaE
MGPVETIRTFSEEETMAAGRELAERLRGVVLLHGDLGAGKTTLTRGIVSGIDGTQADEVSSPTFTLIHDYGAGVFHIDLYRLDSERQIDTLGLEEIFDEARLVLIEWGEKLGSRAPSKRSEITLESAGDNERLIHVALAEE